MKKYLAPHPMALKKKQQILAMLLVMAVVIGLLPIATINVNAAYFSPRLTQPNREAFSVGNPFVSSFIDNNNKYHSGNCTWYAWGRAREILGSAPTFNKGNARYWFNNVGSYPNPNDRYARGQTAKLGAIICWDSAGLGHLGVVEKIEGTQVTISESNYDYGYFHTRTFTAGSYNTNTLTFQGFIYIGDFSNSPPLAPSSASISSSYAGVAATITSSWAAVSYAERYSVGLFHNGTEVEHYELTGTSRNFTANSPGEYKIRTYAYNSAGWSSDYRESGTITIYPDKTVTFVDYDGTVIGKQQSVRHGTGATAPLLPSREGHTCQGWDKTFNNVTEDITVTAVYTVNRYTVRFRDKEGAILSTQSIYWSTPATPPTVTPPAGWEFIGWDSDNYKNVKSDLDIAAVYKWGNPAIPHVLKIEKAIRAEDHEGYYVRIRLIDNDPMGTSRGRAIVVLKTESEKVVATEVQTYTLQELKDTTKQIYVPYSGVATKAEVSLVGLLADGNTGVPLAQIATDVIDLGLVWSEWSPNLPPLGSEYLTESRNEYRYRDKQTTTSSSSTMNGWTQYSSAWVWGSWSGWSSDSYSSSPDREVEEQSIPATYRTVHQYYHYCKSGGYCANSQISGYTYHTIDTDTAPTTWNYTGKTSSGNIPYWTFWSCGNRDMWFPGTYYTGLPYQDFPKDILVQAAYTQWRYRDKNYTYYFEKWGDWTDWLTDTAPTATASKEVEARTVHRFKANDIKLTAYNYMRYKYINLSTSLTHYAYSSAYPDSMGYPGEWEYNKTYAEKTLVEVLPGNVKFYGGYNEDSWYEAYPYITFDTLEDTNGKERRISGEIGVPGKLATLLVFRETNQDPTASQLEYVDQTILGNNGEYDFTYRTKDEPSAKTGDFIIMLAVEGGSSPIYIGRVEAPKPVYTVVFADEDGTELSRQSVIEGRSAILPANPVKEGYEFRGWDDTTTRIRQDMTFAATYAKKKFNVVFVDWENNDIEVREFEYGDVLRIENVPDKEGSIFAGWSTLEGNDVLTVRQNMIVAAKYNLKTYSVKFLDWNGDVISAQTVEYGGEADVPLIEDPSEANRMFKEWSHAFAAIYVTEDLLLTPISMFTQTAAAPQISLASGNYNGTQTVTITCSTPNAKIYFTTDGTIPEYTLDAQGTYTNGHLYYAPITVSEETPLMAVAFVNGMNESYIAYEHYTFDTQSGVSVTGKVKTYNPKIPTTIQLMQNNVEMYKTTIAATTGSSHVEQTFSLEGVVPGTYTLVVTKPTHTPFTVQTIVVGEQNVDLTQDARPEVKQMILPCGDINGDNMINDTDLTVLWMVTNYNKNAAAASNPLCDLNGDGMINDGDLTILWMGANYNKGKVIIN